MIVGCYVMDLYCENGGSEEHNFKISFPAQFTGETASECRKSARARGWKLDLVQRFAYCPLCVKSGNAPTRQS